MSLPNKHYGELKDSYLFFNIAQKVKKYQADHPDKKMYRLGIGDVSLPLCDAVIKALHKGVDDQANKDSFLMCYAAPDIAKFYGTAWGAINAAADMVAHTAPNRMTAGYAENNWNRIMSGHQFVDAVTAAVSK